MAFHSPNLECRMYEAKYPKVDTVVMIQVRSIGDMGVNVSLLEYNNIEGIILTSELSRRRFRSVNIPIKVGRIEPAMVVYVEEKSGFVTLSKGRVSEEDIEACRARYNKSSLVHSIMRSVAQTQRVDLEWLYENIGWPLHRKYGHALKAFMILVNDPDSIWTYLSHEVKETGPDGHEARRRKLVMPLKSLIRNFKRNTLQTFKIRAAIQMICFQFDGVLHIQAAMRKAEAAGSVDCPVKISLVSPPLYVLTTKTFDKERGITILSKAITACTEEIELHKGNLTVKEAPRVVSKPK